jgi:hypothetical protein
MKLDGFGFFFGDVFFEKGFPIINHVIQRRILAQEGVWSAFYMGLSAAPGIILGLLNHFGSDRIKFHIADSGEKVSLIHGVGGEPPLEEMPSPALSEINMPAVSSMGLADSQPQAFFRFRAGDQMHVIGHQTVGPDGNRVLHAPFLKQREVETEVSFPEEYILPSVASLNDMVRYFRGNGTGKSGHGGILTWA